jgi:hypothetical protein
MGLYWAATFCHEALPNVTPEHPWFTFCLPNVIPASGKFFWENTQG